MRTAGSHILGTILGTLVAVLCLVGHGSAVAGDRMEPTPKELESVDVIEKLGEALPLDRRFMDSEGRSVALGDLIGKKPVILTFNYSDCPMLCSVQLGGLVEAMQEMQLSLGVEYELITIGLDPMESKERSAETKAMYIERYAKAKEGSAKAKQSWHFLRGTAEDIRAVADSVGFGYHYHRPRREYLHPAVLILVSPQEGKVSSYLYGTRYEADNLRDNLLTAAMGDISQSTARFIHSCYHYISPKGNGAVVAKIMRYGGLVFVIGFVIALGVYGVRRSDEGRFHSVGSSEDHV